MRLYLMTLGALVLAAVACDDPATPGPVAGSPAAGVSPSETAVTTTPPAATTCPVAVDGCAFSEALVGWIRAADVDALNQAGAPQPLQCYGDTDGAGGNRPLCDGGAAGEMRDGYPVHRLNTDGGGAVVDFRPDLRWGVLRGSGSVEAIGFHCPDKDGAADCRAGFVLFFSGAPNIVVERIAGNYRITALPFSDFAQERTLLQKGGVFALPWREGIVPGRFLPWRPQLSGPVADETVQRWVDAPLDVPKLELSPSEGSCPEALTVRGRGFTSYAKDPKDPRVQIELLPGRQGPTPPVIRPRPVFALNEPVNPDGSWEHAFTLSSTDREVCSSGTFTVLVSGSEWAIAYFHVR